jgi:hypothetical protein
MREVIEFISSYQKDIDATQIAEVLWLSQFFDKKPESASEKEPIPQSKSFTKSTESQLPKEVSHTIKLSEESKHEKELSKKQYSVERNSRGNSVYATKLALERSFPNIATQFTPLQIKQTQISRKKIDESKSADYFATTDIFNPIFQTEKFYDAYFDLNIVVDQNESMFLWDEEIKHFIQSMNFSKDFYQIRIFDFDSSLEKVVLKSRKTEQEYTYNASIFKQKKTLTLMFSDVVGNAWRSNQMFSLLNEWSKYAFVAIVSMLPKQMWQRTSLREGESRFMKMRRFPPKNRYLESEYKLIEKKLLDNAKNALRVPVIPYDNDAFYYLSNLLIGEKDSLINTKIFKKLELTSSEVSDQDIDAQTRVQRFFNSVSTKSKELAIYCSVLPLNHEIIKELIRVKKLGSNMNLFAEFYFGGLLDKTTKAEIGEYDFYTGVRKELLQYISMEVAREVFYILSEVVTQSLGVRYSMLELLFEHDLVEGELLSEKEIALAKLLMEILDEKGQIYQKDIDKIAPRVDVVYPKSNTYQMGSNDGYYDYEKPVHQITFDYDFAIAKYPVTFEEYDLYCEVTGAKKPDDRGWGRGKRPVINVSWHDANDYCKWLSEQTGDNYRLPTEAEWEYACRAGTDTKWSFGDDEKELEKYAWYDKNSNSKTHLVGEKKENPWGLYDMHGNVWEWCLDDWVDNYEDTPRDGKAYENKKLINKVQRGGSWDNSARYTRSAYRSVSSPSIRYVYVGFRVAKIYS